MENNTMKHENKDELPIKLPCENCGHAIEWHGMAEKHSGACFMLTDNGRLCKCMEYIRPAPAKPADPDAHLSGDEYLAAKIERGTANPQDADDVVATKREIAVEKWSGSFTYTAELLGCEPTQAAVEKEIRKLKADLATAKQALEHYADTATWANWQPVRSGIVKAIRYSPNGTLQNKDPNGYDLAQQTLDAIKPNAAAGEEGTV